jgi:hypothetical protein
MHASTIISHGGSHHHHHRRPTVRIAAASGLATPTSAEGYCGRLAEAVAGVCEAAADHQRAGKVRRPLRPLRRPFLAEIYLCNVCSCQERLRRNGRG